MKALVFVVALVIWNADKTEKHFSGRSLVTFDTLSECDTFKATEQQTLPAKAATAYADGDVSKVIVELSCEKLEGE